ncbi:tyrosine-type recombinase/integrase [Actinocatenispora rupis]|uniref:Site-specific recombinase XerD n=2 Tax=Actinocatenispora rupis TaxID=519421 RepID=A0A8J3J8D8_9ACTN|nr:tyrosine-type recombinase/integrase [Actinocatenispora rupis]GID10248.1 hypothetical protein Aru02nite_11370 [Actinocatenispora rupis]
MPEPGDEATAAIVGDILEAAIADRQPLPTTEEVRRRIRSGLGPGDYPLVGEFLDHWLADRKRRGNLSMSTFRTYEAAIRLYHRPYLGHLRLDRLRRWHILDELDEIDTFNAQLYTMRASSDPALRALVRYRKPAGPTTVRHHMRVLHAALNSAVAEHLIASNPAEHLDLPSGSDSRALLWTDERVERWEATGRVPGRVMVWTPEQTGRFLDYAIADRLYALWYLLAFVGLRRGEACGLERGDVSRRTNTITIRQQLLLDGWTPVLSQPKTAGSAATVPIPGEVTDILTAHDIACGMARHEAGTGWHDSELLFTEADGAPLHPQKLSRQFSRMAREAGLPPISLHALRHGAATLALEAGTDMKVVQAMLRHTMQSTTLDLYTTVSDQLGRTATSNAIGIVPRST